MSSCAVKRSKSWGGMESCRRLVIAAAIPLTRPKLAPGCNANPPGDESRAGERLRPRLTPRENGSCMPKISRFFGIIVQMYYADHEPPHFHVRYSGQKALIAIDTLAVARASFTSGIGPGYGVGGAASPGVDGGLDTGKGRSTTQVHVVNKSTCPLLLARDLSGFGFRWREPPAF
jgi:hypothetical protein